MAEERDDQELELDTHGTPLWLLFVYIVLLSWSAWNVIRLWG